MTTDRRSPEAVLAGGIEAPDPGRWNRLRARLADAAGGDGLLDVAYTRVPSPVGDLLLAATPAGVVRVAFDTEDPDAVLEDLALRVSPRVLEAPAPLDRARRELDEYFTGARTHFDLALDWRLTARFRQRVLLATAAIPYGETATYRSVAAAAGNPRAVRAAGSALATNPLPIIVPCHRVLRSDGTLGGYGGGLHRKDELLRREAGDRGGST
ncbi:MAG TPA: methylated-DNA--[protein]-cysteine S-methyltransferase [Acidimicrobiales bacterium]|nr:methylated-DNA--[protein]-cysteine S-methyltransferase [Acidimicrobiales bacterium]